MFGKKQAKRQMGLSDRLSQLPEFILHMILSIIDIKEACRASLVSRNLYKAWLSIPVLDFKWEYLKKCTCDPWNCLDKCYDVETVNEFVMLIGKTMHRYFDQKRRIRKLVIEFPKVNETFEYFLDKWIGIAVENQVGDLNIKILDSGSPGYRLPEILFRAKSLKVLNCDHVELPYYGDMELYSLERLTLVLESVDTDMLQRIISVCPLVELDVTKDGLEKMLTPWKQSNENTFSLRKFVYCGLCQDLVWPWNVNVRALKNLRKVEIKFAVEITDDIVSKLASGLVALESLVLSSCSSLRYIHIASKTLKEFHIIEGSDLKKVTIDAPNLVEFLCNCEVETSVSLISSHSGCIPQFIPWFESIDTSWFVTLKKFLIETENFKFLVMDFSECRSFEIAVEELKNIVTGPPYKLKELKLHNYDLPQFCHESFLTEILDALFWSCHPDVLSITTGLNNTRAQMVLSILKGMARCWKHPLKGIEVEGADLSSLLETPSKLEIRFRLSW